MDVKVENLNSGVLLKLLRDMNDDEKNESDEDRKPILLQIRSIIPVTADDELWPEQGFYLKVSDSSHAMYVSLLHQQDEMVLRNKLQLGQLIFVEKLKPAYPVPFLKGVVPVPGRHPCKGDPEDLDFIEGVTDMEVLFNSVTKLGAPEKKVTQKFRSSSASKNDDSSIVENRGRGSRISDVNDGSHQSLSSTSIVNKYCESDMLGRMTTPPPPRRKSWNTSEIIESMHIIKHGWKPMGRSRSACTSPIRPSNYTRSLSNVKTLVKDTGRSSKSVKNSPKASSPAKSSENCGDSKSMLNAVINEKKIEQCKIVWNSLPPNLVDHGKEVLKNKEAAMLAAVDALQDASTCDRILKCLSAYSEIQSTKMPCHQLSVDKFFNLEDNLTQTLMIFQSLKSVSPQKENDNDQNNKSSLSEALKLASERKKNATSWINLALESDLSTFSSDSNSTPKQVSKHATTLITSKRSNVNTIHKTKGVCLVKMQKGNGDDQLGFAADHNPPEWERGNSVIAADHNPPEWERGNSVIAASELANSLLDECGKWFLEHAEKYLDEADIRAATKSDCEVADIMRQIKKVNDWLDNMTRCKDELKEDEVKAYGRLRNKIYSILLKNLERTALALESTNVPSS